MAQPRTPPLYTTGRWTLRSPYSTEITTTATYVCKAIRSFDDLTAMDIDPYARFYEPSGIDRDTYQEDATALANIVTLMSDSHPTVYVPDTYILSYPDTTLVPYRHMVLAASLGAIPDTLVLDDLEEQMTELILNRLGIESQIKFFQAPGIAENVDYLTYQATENNRKARIANNTTKTAEVLSLQDTVDQLTLDKQVLIDICQRNGLL